VKDVIGRQERWEGMGKGRAGGALEKEREDAHDLLYF